MSDRMLDDLIDDVLNTMFDGNDLIREVARELEYQLKDSRGKVATVFYDVAESELKLADDEAYRAGRELTRNSRYYEDTIKVVVNVMTAFVAVTVREIGDMLNSRDYDELADIYDRVFGSDRGRGRDRDRGRDRGRDRDDRRDSRRDSRRDDRGRGRDRDDRDSGRPAQAAYGRNERSDRDRDGRRDRERPARESRTDREDLPARETQSRPGREQNVAEGEVLVRHGQVLDVGKITLPLAANSVINYDGKRTTGWVINPLLQRIRAVLSNDNRIVAQVFMEPYEKHELGYAYGLVSSDEKVMPIVDFTKVPDFADPVALDNSPTWKFTGERMQCYDQALNPTLVLQKADTQVNHLNDDGAVIIMDQTGEYSLPLRLKEDMEGAGISLIPETFNGWAAFMGMLKVYLLDMNNDSEDRLRAQQAYTAIDGVLCRMLRDMLRINHGDWASTGEFAEDWPEVAKLLEDPKHSDDLSLFKRDEVNFLTSYIASSYKLTDDNRWMLEVRAHYLVMACTNYFLGANVLPTRINRYCEVEQQYTPEFFSAMNRLMRLRNNRYSLTPVLLSDANRQAVRMVSGMLDGARIWMLLGL